MQGDTKKKKKVGALLSAVVFGGLVATLAICTLVDGFSVPIRGGETAIIIISALMLFALVVGVVIALVQRWREIQKGEEDEARKY